eukprot:SAG11_NODE_13038_length_673_cov_0.660279_1_plen_49_part_00
MAWEVAWTDVVVQAGRGGGRGKLRLCRRPDMAPMIGCERAQVAASRTR